MIEAEDGSLVLVGRYRNKGDSRTGLAAGERGMELAIFKSFDKGKSFDLVRSYSKKDLSQVGHPVVSIEGSCLVRTNEGVELFVSSEKAELPYPDSVREYRKPGAGVWTIDRMSAKSVEELSIDSLTDVLHSNDARYLHLKDPFSYTDRKGNNYLLFCTHPYGWTSHNTAYVVRNGSDGFSDPSYDFFPRGPSWDVAMTRATAILPLPQRGSLSGGPPMSLIFYDGGECLRSHDEHSRAVHRPRGYSCEELGGMALLIDDDFSKIVRVSDLFPLFTSPWGSGSSRYVDVLMTPAGYYATWQQSQEDWSQPLVMNFVSTEEANALLK